MKSHNAIKTNREIIELMLESGAETPLALFTDVPAFIVKEKMTEFAHLREQFRRLLELNQSHAANLCRDYQNERAKLAESILLHNGVEHADSVPAWH